MRFCICSERYFAVAENFFKFTDVADIQVLLRRSCLLPGRLQSRCRFLEQLRSRKVLWGMVAAAALVLLATALHTDWIISKNLGTLPWCFYVSALSVALYTLLRVLEARGYTGWARILGPAGTATLTVYMVPYLFYSIWVFLAPEVPRWLSGWVGVGKCILFSALCIWTADLLGRIGLKLKI